MNVEDKNVGANPEQLTKWADTCLRINHLNTLVQREIAAGSFSRASDLSERARWAAWTLFNEMIMAGASKHEGYCEPDAAAEPDIEFLQMNAALEFHDSKIQLIEEVNGTLRITFSAAYIHRSSGRPGIDAGAGYVQPVDLVFSDATALGLNDDCKGGLSNGVIFVGEEQFSLVPLPYCRFGAVSAKLVFTSGAVLKIAANSFACALSGVPRFIETFNK